MNTSAQKSSENHPSLSDDIEKAVFVHSLIADHYLFAEIYVKMDQIVDPNNHVHAIDARYCRALADLFCNYNYNNVRSMMKVYFLSTIIFEGGTHATVFAQFPLHKVAKRRLLHCHAR